MVTLGSVPSPPPLPPLPLHLGSARTTFSPKDSRRYFPPTSVCGLGSSISATSSLCSFALSLGRLAPSSPCQTRSHCQGDTLRTLCVCVCVCVCVFPLLYVRTFLASDLFLRAHAHAHAKTWTRVHVALLGRIVLAGSCCSTCSSTALSPLSN